MAGWFDSHCHVQEEYLPGEDGAAAELEPVLVRAAEAGIDRLVCIGTGAVTSLQAVTWPGRPPIGRRDPASLGLHRPPSARSQ